MWVCLSVTFHIVDLWQYFICCVRSGVTDAPSLWCSTCASTGYARCFGRTSVYLWASSLQNLTVSQYFYSPHRLTVSLWNDLIDTCLLVWD